jgi:hypothetical protein
VVQAPREEHTGCGGPTGEEEFVNKHTNHKFREGIQHSVNIHLKQEQRNRRFNRAYIVRGGAMLLHAGMKWIGSVLEEHFIYEETNLYIEARKWKTPYELFYKRKPYKMDYLAWGAWCMDMWTKGPKKEINKALPADPDGPRQQWTFSLPRYERRQNTSLTLCNFLFWCFPLGRNTRTIMRVWLRPDYDNGVKPKPGNFWR